MLKVTELQNLQRALSLFPGWGNVDDLDGPLKFSSTVLAKKCHGTGFRIEALLPKLLDG